MSFFDRLFGRSSTKSGSVAKERLQVVLIQDRVKIPPAVMDRLRGELVEVISKYVDVDADGIDISLAQTARQNRLVADVPILGSKLKTNSEAH
jgi:cell division topological specificity factor